MLLTRLGSKKKIAKPIYQKFPNHKMRIELFFGAGGFFFNAPRAKYNILNDLDDDVTNLFLVVKERKKELYQAVELLPITSSLVKHWHKKREDDPLYKAIRFLFLSNFTYLGKGNTLRLGLGNQKAVLLKQIEFVFRELKDTLITNYDFRDVIGKISFSDKLLKKKDVLCYLDPCYLDTENYYKVPKWTEESTFDCFEIMSNSGINCALSEFDHPFVIQEAKKRDFNIIDLGERKNIKNRRKELLITNYDNNQMTLNF